VEKSFPMKVFESNHSMLLQKGLLNLTDKTGKDTTNGAFVSAHLPATSAYFHCFGIV
jgi:hypothetical protein